MAEKIDYELTEAEADLLLTVTRDAMGDAGAKGGAIGGSMGGAPGEAGGRSGGRSGGRFGARLTKAQTAGVTIDVPLDAEATRGRAHGAIAQNGIEVDDPNEADDGSIWGVIPSGAMNMMPALIRVQVDPTDSGARVHLRASGREGLIKQRVGAKAVDRIAAAITHEP